MGKKQVDLATLLMGGPQGRGHPISPEALGVLEARSSGIPPEANDGRNQTYNDRARREFREFWEPKLAEAIQNIPRHLSGEAQEPPPPDLLRDLFASPMGDYLQTQIQGLLREWQQPPQQLAEDLTRPQDPVMGLLQQLFSQAPQQKGDHKWIP